MIDIELLTDDINAVDEAVPSGSFTFVFSDAISISEELLVDKNSPQDAISVTDSVSREMSFGVVLSDTLDATDLQTFEAQYFRTPSDTISITDSVTRERSQIIDRSVDDTASITDPQVLIEKTFPQDTISVTDALDKVVDYHRILADVATLTEVNLAETESSRTVEDNISVTDSLNVAPLLERTVGDTISVTDTLALATSYVRLPTDTLDIGESLVVTPQRYFQIVLGDTAAITEFSLAEVINVDVDVADTIAVSDTISIVTNTSRVLSDTISISETIQARKGGEVDRSASDTIAVTDSHILKLFPGVVEDAIAISDSAIVELVGAFQAVFDLDGRGVTIPLTQEVPYSELNLESFDFISVGGGVPFQPVHVDGVVRTLQTGTSGAVQASPTGFSITFTLGGSSPTSTATVIGKVVSIADTFSIGDTLTVEKFGPSPSTYLGGFHGGHIGSYIEIQNGSSPGAYRITGILSAQSVTLDRPLPCLDPQNGFLQWSLTSAVQALHFTLGNKASNNRYYRFESLPLRTKTGDVLNPSGTFYAQGISKPRLESVSCDLEGVVTLVYDQPMMVNRALLDLGEYSITGPTNVRLMKSWSDTPDSISIETLGLTLGVYTLNVNYTGTPKDEGDNPIDPEYSSMSFQAFLPERHRSIFTDKGPIAKPEELLQTGFGVTVNSFNEISISGGSFDNSHIGMYLRVGPMGIGANGYVVSAGPNITADEVMFAADTITVELNDEIKYTSLAGDFKILGIVSATRVRVQASFRFPEPSGVSSYWNIVNPKGGQIADNPLDVMVTVNGAMVLPEAVRGLLGQIVLPEAPGPSADVKVSYTWCPNPTVEVRTLNSPEFRLNSWNRNSGPSRSQHTYRYNNVLVNSNNYEPELNQALLKQPKLRELHYRGFERAYTPVLNDPSTLILNSPIHRIAYPAATRTLEEVFVGYEASVLPEEDTPTWNRKGAGSTSISGNTLIVTDNVSGTYPYGQPLFWVQPVDLTFPHIYALSWRFRITSVSTLDGVFTGLCVGYSDEQNAYVVGFLNVAGVRKIGILKKGSLSPSLLESWTGGLDPSGNPTGAPVDVDWSQLRSYRILRDISGRVRLFVDGNITDTLRVIPSDVPTLQELNSPFDEIQGTFFGSLSRLATSVSQWDFVRYTVIPTNPIQVSPSVYVNYEGADVPEAGPKPWTPVGSYGTETINSSALLLDSTSATVEIPDPDIGLIGGAYRGFFRLEPLLSSASQVIVDAHVAIRSQTHGIDPNGLTFAVNDGTRLMQVSFLADKVSPKISYGGGSFPEDFNPYSWTSMGAAPTEMFGRYLRITDDLTDNGRVYFYEDLAPAASSDRVIYSAYDYVCEFRAKVNSYTVDGSGFAGAFAQVFDGSRAVGLLLAEVAGVKKVVFHTDGVFLGSFNFDWGTDLHSYRLVKSTLGNLVTLFVDGTYLGSQAYSSFSASSGTAYVSFGSSTPSSATALSEVDWEYCNAWRLVSSRKYVGIWKGSDPNSLTGYHLPVKASGTAKILGNTLQDTLADFNTLSVGDLLIIDTGDNKGTYEIAALVSSDTLTITTTWPVNPTEVNYRVVAEVDWTIGRKYRLFKDTSGQVSLFEDAVTDPLIQVTYNSINFPSNDNMMLDTISGGIPAVIFGSFNSENLEQSVWDYVRYGISRSLTELRVVPHHQVLNQWNVMESPERLYTIIPHDLTSFKSSSTGIAPKKPYDDLLENPALEAYTLLNEDTPLMPKTQSFAIRKPYPVQQPIAGINNINNVLNSPGGFTLNNGALQYRLVVPDDVLYSSLEVIEQETGETTLIAPAMDDLHLKGLQYQKEICLSYDGSVLPENDTTAPTPWVLESDIPAQVLATALAGVLTYRTLGSPTVYKNNTPLPDAIGLTTEVKFRLRLKDDSTLGTADTQVRFGVSAPGMTLALAFVTTPLLERLVLILDLKANKSMGAFSHDFLDGNFYTYRIIRDGSAGTVKVSIEP